MNTINKVLVYMDDDLVGTLSILKDKRIGFEYSDYWLKNGFELNPFYLPLEKKIFINKKDYFAGLYGAFCDSLPDGWGNILVNRFLRSKGIDPDSLNILDRLSIVGSSGMGKLRFVPDNNFIEKNEEYNLDELAVECNKILNSEFSEKIDELYTLAGSSGGARPKVLVNIDNEEWIIKFNGHLDKVTIGKMEYDYYVCAKECGINMSESKLFKSNLTPGYFGTKRFDRENGKRIHMISVAALLEINFIIPSLDYKDLFKLTKILSNNNEEDIEQLFRRMCFNIFSHNQDDHAKNFSFIYNEEEKMYRLSPAYDLTYSSTYYGEHMTSVNGKGKNILDSDLLDIGIKSGINKNKCNEIIKEIKEKVNIKLKNYLQIIN